MAETKREPTDAERLDWMEAHLPEIDLGVGGGPYVVRGFRKEIAGGTGPTLRAAIDAAMRKAKGEGTP